MNFREFHLLSEIQQIGFQVVQEKKLFGPVYHGTTEENRQEIMKSGCKFNISPPSTGGTRHGYELGAYGTYGGPPPIHHLGFGVYFTTKKAIAKAFNQNSGKGLTPYYLDVPRLETINFGSSNTMMGWWSKNGYNMPAISTLADKNKMEIEKIWIDATNNLTQTLKSKFDAVWFKGQGIRRLLDGDQICVYDPSKIYMLDTSLNQQDAFLAGDRVKIKGVPVAVIITGMREAKLGRDVWDKLLGQKSNFIYTVKLTPQDSKKIQEFYLEKIYDLFANHPDFQEFLQMRMNNSGQTLEQSARAYAEHITSKGSLELNFPESLFEKKLVKGERIPKS